ncbi:MAG: flagellar motor switch protein FliM [Lentisphaerota bacterium]
MDKTLSQEEVDALLQAMKTGEVKVEEEQPKVGVDEVKVVEYNFRKPRLVSGDQLRGFQVLHDVFVKSLQTALFVSLKTSLEIKLVAIDQFTYGEFVLSLLKPTYIAVLSTTPNCGDVAVEMNLPIVMAMIDILLGGDGTSPQEPRELTAIELSISSDIMEVVTQELTNAWASITDMKFAAQSYESNPEYVQMATSEALVMSVTLDMRLGEISGVLNICYPFLMLQPMLDKISSRVGAKRDVGGSKTERSHDEILTSMNAVPLDVHAVLGRSSVLASQVANLKPGDIIRLDRRIDKPVEILVGNRLCFQGQAGQSNGKAAVKLTANIVALEKAAMNGTAQVKPPPKK